MSFFVIRQKTSKFIYILQKVGGKTLVFSADLKNYFPNFVGYR